MRTPLLSLLPLVTLLATNGCTAGYAEDDTVVGEDWVVGDDHPRQAFEYFVRTGMDDIDAAAIVGNLQQESTPAIDPRASEPGAPGRGIAQWGANVRWNGNTADSVRAFAARNHQPMESFDLQLRFITYELDTYPRIYGTAAFRAATTLDAATLAFMRGYEQCGTCVQGRRLQYARAALQRYGNTASSSDVPDKNGGSGSKPSSDPPPDKNGGSSDPPSDKDAGAGGK